ncbi:MAG: hypothetical protein WC712_06455 [Candidatus Brocadiia bacterium]
MVIMLFLGLSFYLFSRGIYLRFMLRTDSIFAGRSGFFVLTVHSFALLIIVTFLYANYVEPSQLTYPRYTFESSKITKNIRMVFLSDLDWPVTGVDILRQTGPDTEADQFSGGPIGAINSFAPQVIFVGGDMITEPQTAIPEEFFRRLNCQKRYGCLGNVDPVADITFYKKCGITSVNDATMPFSVDGAEIQLLGKAWSGSDITLFTAPPSDSFRVFLTHSPDYIAAAAVFGFDLYLSGHTHGGQVRFPFKENIFVPSDLGQLYPYGHFLRENMNVVVTKGLGMVGGTVPRIRFFCPPEIVFIEIAPLTAKETTK